MRSTRKPAVPAGHIERRDRWHGPRARQEMLLRHRAAGWTRDRMYAELASMAVAAPEHEDYLHDLMDFVSGYCSPT